MRVGIIRLTFVRGVTLLFTRAHANTRERTHAHTSPSGEQEGMSEGFGARAPLGPTPSRFPMQEPYESGPSRIQRVTLRVPETLWVQDLVGSDTRLQGLGPDPRVNVQLEGESCCRTVPEAAGNFSSRKPRLKSPEDGNCSKTTRLKSEQRARRAEQTERLLEDGTSQGRF